MTVASGSPLCAVGRNECKEVEVLSVRIRDGKEVVEKKNDNNESNRLSMGLYCNFSGE